MTVIDFSRLASTAIRGEDGAYSQIGKGSHVGIKVLKFGTSRKKAIYEYIMGAWAAQSGYAPKVLALGKTPWPSNNGNRLSCWTIYLEHLKGDTLANILTKYGLQKHPHLTPGKAMRFAAESNKFDELIAMAGDVVDHLRTAYDMPLSDQSNNFGNFMYYPRRQEMKVIDFSREWEAATESLQVRLMGWARDTGILERSVPRQPYLDELIEYGWMPQQNALSNVS